MKNAILNSFLAISSAFLLTILLHEIAHFLTAILLGYDATLYHNRVLVQTIELDINKILFSGIAPIFSLAQGLVAYEISKKLKTSILSLFLNWFGVAGIITFFGYLFIAPLIPFGDTGQVFHLLKVPFTLQLIISILAVILLTIILMKSTVTFERFAEEDLGSTKQNRKRWAFSLILIPLFLSIPLITLFQFPIPHFASALATICAPFSIMAIFGTFMGSKHQLQKTSNGKSINSQISIRLITFFCIVLLINRTLVNGFW